MQRPSVNCSISHLEYSHLRMVHLQVSGAACKALGILSCQHLILISQHSDLQVRTVMQTAVCVILGTSKRAAMHPKRFTIVIALADPPRSRPFYWPSQPSWHLLFASPRPFFSLPQLSWPSLDLSLAGKLVAPLCRCRSGPRDPSSTCKTLNTRIQLSDPAW